MRENPWIVLLTSSFLAVSLILFSPPAAEAQIDLGGQLLYDADLQDGTVGLGARAGVELPIVGLGVHADANWYFPESAGGVDSSFWELLGGVTYGFIPLSPASPYVGAGLVRQTSSTDGIDFDDTGLNLLGGVALGGLSPINGFGELSYRVMDDFDNQFVISLGLLF